MDELIISWKYLNTDRVRINLKNNLQSTHQLKITGCINGLYCLSFGSVATGARVYRNILALKTDPHFFVFYWQSKKKKHSVNLILCFLESLE